MTPWTMPPWQRSVIRAGVVLMLLLAAYGTRELSLSDRREPWQRFGALAAFTVAGPIYMRLVSVGLRAPREGAPGGTKRGLGEVLVEWGPAALAAALALVLWLPLLGA